MTIDYRDHIVQQMSQARYRDGRHERLENGAWVPWPVLTIDRAGAEEARRQAARGPRRVGDS